MKLHHLAIVAIVALSSGLLLAAGCSGEEASPPEDSAEAQAVAEGDADAPESVLDPDPVEAEEEDEDGALRGYVSTTALYIRSGPGTTNAVVGVLVENDPVTIIGTSDSMNTTWWQVEAAGGYLDGWVSSAFMEHGRPPGPAREEVGYGEPETPTLVAGPFQYLGVAGCRDCHVDSTGSHPRGAFPVWDGHLHSEAYASLSRDYTIEIARRVRGVEDPTTDWRCLKCHVTAFGAAPEQLAPSYSDADGVSCEVCHGPGSAYAEVDHGASNPDRYALGFKKLTNLEEREALCVSCHNEASPTYKPFNVMAFSREIRHWPDPDDAAYFAQAESQARKRESRRQLETRAAEAERARQAREAEALRREEEHRRATADPAEADAAALADAQRAEEEARRAAAEAEAAEANQSAKQAKEAEARAAEEARQATADRAATESADRAAAEASAKAALEAKKAEEEAQRARQAQLAKDAQKQASSGGPLDRYLKDVPDEILLNRDGVKRDKVRFTHAAHASAKYVAGVECQTCHHTQEGTEKPEPCTACHDVGGDAGEENLKSKSTHQKALGFPQAAGVEHVSCVGCHKSQNALLAAGKRSGEKAPSKCSLCHKKKGS